MTASVAVGSASRHQSAEGHLQGASEITAEQDQHERTDDRRRTARRDQDDVQEYPHGRQDDAVGRVVHQLQGPQRADDDEEDHDERGHRDGGHDVDPRTWLGWSSRRDGQALP